MIVQFKLIHLLSDGCERCALVCAGVCECVQVYKRVHYLYFFVKLKSF